jgi:large subunit ribosomal protein L13
VIVINAGQVKLTGAKPRDKMYYRFSGHPGGLSEKSFTDVVRVKPTYPIERAVKGMLPKNVLGRRMFTKLKIYGGAEHPHQAQRPETLAL